MSKTPVFFFGHGSPMNALGGPIAEEWRSLGQSFPKPRAMLMVSAHWYIPEVAVTAMERPRTIHDFGGFPKPLFDMTYDAPGAPWLAERVGELLAPLPVRADEDWGLDHGTWSVLAHVWPDADVPIAQLSIDRTKGAQFHYDLGRKLAPLRDEGVLIAASGDVVHNLRTAHQGPAHDWAISFNDRVKAQIEAGDDPALLAPTGPDAALSIPTPEHYLPLLYALGARDKSETPRFFTDVIDLGSASMLGVRFG
jgi:4,5-DOPA dioxygenase extradiol